MEVGIVKVRKYVSNTPPVREDDIKTESRSVVIKSKVFYANAESFLTFSSFSETAVTSDYIDNDSSLILSRTTCSEINPVAYK
jgi:hypothetical protein